MAFIWYITLYLVKHQNKNALGGRFFGPKVSSKQKVHVNILSTDLRLKGLMLNVAKAMEGVIPKIVFASTLLLHP